MTDPTQREAIQKLLRRVDEVRGLESLPVGPEVAEGEETARLLATAEGLVDELENARRRLIETNVQLVSLREVAHSMVSSVGTEETTRLIVMVALVVLNVTAELVSFSAVIDRVPPLRAFDRLGRRRIPTGPAAD